MERWFKGFVVFFAALAICYVLVSPLVPTPNALHKNQTVQIVFVVPALLIPAIAIIIARSGLREQSFGPACPDVLALTCSRLC